MAFVHRLKEAKTGPNLQSQGMRAMLVLTRRRNESIIINDNIKIVVIGIRGDRVRLGIEAPPEIPVHRREVFEQIRKTQQGTSQAGGQIPPEPSPQGEDSPANATAGNDSSAHPRQAEDQPASVASERAL
jgi:carbon storage regulator